MQIDTAAAIDLSKEKKQNESSFSDQMKAYIKHPGSGVLALLTLLGAVLTFALLFFLIGYILVKGVPYLSTDLFSLTYNSENLSLLPSLINTFILTVVSLVIAAPLGIFAAIYLVEYAKKGSKLVNVIRITAETLSGIPSIVYGLFGMLFFVTALHWGLSLLSGAFTLVIMILPLIMRTAEEALKSVPDSYREASFGLGAGKLRTISSTWYSGRCDPGHRTCDRRNSSPDLYSRYSCRGTEEPDGFRTYSGTSYVCAVR